MHGCCCRFVSAVASARRTWPLQQFVRLRQRRLGPQPHEYLTELQRQALPPAALCRAPPGSAPGRAAPAPPRRACRSRASGRRRRRSRPPPSRARRAPRRTVQRRSPEPIRTAVKLSAHETRDVLGKLGVAAAQRDADRPREGRRSSPGVVVARRRQDHLPEQPASPVPIVGGGRDRARTSCAPADIPCDRGCGAPCRSRRREPLARVGVRATPHAAAGIAGGASRSRSAQRYRPTARTRARAAAASLQRFVPVARTDQYRRRGLRGRQRAIETKPRETLRSRTDARTPARAAPGTLDEGDLDGAVAPDPCPVDSETLRFGGVEGAAVVIDEARVALSDADGAAQAEGQAAAPAPRARAPPRGRARTSPARRLTSMTFLSSRPHSVRTVTSASDGPSSSRSATASR